MKTIYLTALTVPSGNTRFVDGVLCAVGSYLKNLSNHGQSELHVLLGSRGSAIDTVAHNQLRRLNHLKSGQAVVRVYDSSEYDFSGSNDTCNVTRHAAMARHLRLLYPIQSRELGLDLGDRVLTFDARDTLFFTDPFRLFWPGDSANNSDDGLVSHRLYVFGEGFDYAADPWNAADLHNLRQHLPDATANVSMGLQKSLPVLNGGFVAGCIQPVAHFLTMRYLFGLASCRDKSKGTDQVQLNFLSHTCEIEFGLPITQVMPRDSLAVIHGHGIWARPEGRFLPQTDLIVYDKNHGRFYGSQSGYPVAVLHQWDRCPQADVIADLQKRYRHDLAKE